MFADGVLKLLDFGLCKEMSTDATQIENTSYGMGTLWYQPPEALEEGEDTTRIKISPKMDVWAAGMIFYEMLYSVRPFGNGLTQSQYFDRS